jgi:hypothetical protein
MERMISGPLWVPELQTVNRNWRPETHPLPGPWSQLWKSRKVRGRLWRRRNVPSVLSLMGLVSTT